MSLKHSQEYPQEEYDQFGAFLNVFVFLLEILQLFDYD